MPSPLPVIVDAVRTPFGALHGALAGWHPVELLGETIRALACRSGVDPATVEELAVGCVEQVGAQAGNLARGALVSAEWSPEVVGTTLDGGAGSGAQALRIAATLVRAGARDCVIAAAVDVASAVPPGAAAMGRHPYGRPWTASAPGLRPPGLAAEALARRAGIDRAAQDAWALRSVVAACDRPPGTAEVHPIPRRPAGTGSFVEHDELPPTRPATPDAVAAFGPLHDPEGTVTAANTAPPADGAAAALVATDVWAERMGLPVLAAVRAVEVAAAWPDEPAGAAVTAARRALARSGLTLDDVDVLAVHEPYAACALAVLTALGADLRHANPRGGALARGDPAATSGLAGALAVGHELALGGGRRGLWIATGPGTATACVLER